MLDEDRGGAVLHDAGNQGVQSRVADVGVAEGGVELDEGERGAGLTGGVDEQRVHELEVKDVGERRSAVDAPVTMLRVYC